MTLDMLFLWSILFDEYTITQGELNTLNMTKYKNTPVICLFMETDSLRQLFDLIRLYIFLMNFRFPNTPIIH